MLTQIEVFDPTTILQPVQNPEDARTDAMRFGVNLTIAAGMAIGIKTADKLAYPYNVTASDGLQTAVGFAMYSFKTDANGMVFYGDSAVAGYRTGPWETSPIWKCGTFDPDELSSTTLVAQVDTITPASTIEAGDLFTLTYTDKGGLKHSVTAASTGTTAASVVTPMVAAWNADPVLGSLAVASGTTTVVLTYRKKGVAYSVAATTTEADGTTSDAQTFTLARSPAASGRVLTDVLSDMGGRILHNGYVKIP